MRVSDVMTVEPYFLSPNDPVEHAAQAMRRHSVGFLPVCESGALAGVITDRDIATGYLAADPSAGAAVRSYMTASPICVSPDADLEEALAIMARAQVRRLCVTSGPQLRGIVSLGDIANAMDGSPEVARALAAISRPLRGGDGPASESPAARAPQSVGRDQTARREPARPEAEGAGVEKIDPVAEEAGLPGRKPPPTPSPETMPPR